MYSSRKKILVLMSTYNGEKYIHEQIDSIINQNTVHDIYIRIRDDGSEDRTCSILEKYAEESSMIELIRGDNKGYNFSFFNLIQNAHGYDYYAISDQDDVWLPNKLQVACDMIDRELVDVPLLYASTSFLVHDNLMPYGETRKKLRPLSMYNTIIQNICPGHTQVMNNALVELLRRNIDTSKVYVYDSWIANVANLYGKILFDNSSHTYYRQYEGNQLGSGSGKIGQIASSIKRKESGDGRKYRKQIEYFLEVYQDKIKMEGYYSEMKLFLNSRTFNQKIHYLLNSRLYRQSRLETVAFWGAVLSNNF